MARLRSLDPLVRTLDTRTVVPPPPNPLITLARRFKFKDPFYNSREFRAWRAKVVARAGGRCEAMDYGHRCTKAAPVHRMFADHIVEIVDGGAMLDPHNGQCLCGPHHLMKTARNRRERLANGRGA